MLSDVNTVCIVRLPLKEERRGREREREMYRVCVCVNIYDVCVHIKISDIHGVCMCGGGVYKHV